MEEAENIVDFLAQVSIFEDLTDEELTALAAITEEYAFHRGSVIAYQRDVADNLYIVREGRLFASSVDDNGIVRDSRSYFATDYFQDVWLFERQAHPATVIGGGDGRVLIIPEEKFLAFLVSHPGALSRLEPEFDENGHVILGLSETAWELAQKTRVKADKRSAAINLLTDELVEFYARRSNWFLLVRLFLPVLGLVALPLAAFWLLNGQQPGSIWFNGRFIVSGLLALIFMVISLFLYLDWLNDYFVITNKHLAHREFSLLTFRSNIIKIPIDQIQSVEVDRPTFLATLLNFGTARITTAATVGTVYFDNIDDPRKVQATLTGLRQQVQALDAGRAQATMRKSIEQHFQAAPNLETVQNGTAVATPTRQKRTFWQNLRRMYAWRTEDNGVITYRKHFLVLLEQIAWPAGLLLGLFAIDFVLIRFFNFTGGDVALFTGLIGMVIFGWLIWRAEDWRNDTFQVSNEYVVDIDRKPFGFGESRKQAALSNVQNVNAIRPNFLATLFRYGNVKIETAGATADIVFENVSNPTQIQSDIFRKRDQFRARQRVKEGEQRRKEYAVLLDVYKQATERDRLPRRTPSDTDIPGYLEDPPIIDYDYGETD